ncbi:MAG: hypothetical protein IT480_01085 [Gammaproteobacteria bacterium]|nr:hypothetical protein [Gammaproteobacteria bacterium]
MRSNSCMALLVAFAGCALLGMPRAEAMISITNAVQVIEGNAGTPPTMTFTVTRSLTDPAEVNYTTAAGTTSQFPTVTLAQESVTPNGCSAGSDYRRTSGTLQFGSSRTGTITVTLCPDYTPEPDEVFTVRVTAAGAQSSSIGMGWILNDDSPMVSIGDSSGLERTPGGTIPQRAQAVFPVRLDRRNPGNQGVVTVWYNVLRRNNDTATSGTSCTAGVDFITVLGRTVVFPDSDSTPKNITVALCPDSVPEEDERFSVVLTRVTWNQGGPNGSGAFFTDSQARGTIRNDD